MMTIKLMAWAFVAFSLSGCVYFVYAVARDVGDRRAARRGMVSREDIVRGPGRAVEDICPVRRLRR